jgi:hypothetical protein
MKRLLIALLFAIPLVACAQTQTFFAAAQFTTNVYLHDSDTPLHLRVPTNAVIDGVTSTNGSATITTNAGIVDIAVVGGSDWSTYAATTNVSLDRNAIVGGIGEDVSVVNSNGSVTLGFFTNKVTIAHQRGSSILGVLNTSGGATDQTYNLGAGSQIRGIGVAATGHPTNVVGTGATLILGSGFPPQVGSLGNGAFVIWGGGLNGKVVAGDYGITLARGSQPIITNSGPGSIFLGTAGTLTATSAIHAAGPISSDTGFYGNFVGSAENLTSFPATLITVSSANTNYYRFTAAPASNTAFGLQHQIAYNSTNIFIYHAASQKWGRATMTLEW